MHLQGNFLKFTHMLGATLVPAGPPAGMPRLDHLGIILKIVMDCIKVVEVREIQSFQFISKNASIFPFFRVALKGEKFRRTTSPS